MAHKATYVTLRIMHDPEDKSIDHPAQWDYARLLDMAVPDQVEVVACTATDPRLESEA